MASLLDGVVVGLFVRCGVGLIILTSLFNAYIIKFGDFFMKDKVFYVAAIGFAVSIIAFGVCFGLGLTDYVGLIASSIALVGLLYAFIQDKRHEKIARERSKKAGEGKTGAVIYDEAKKEEEVKTEESEN